MPEGPEIRRAADTIEKQISGRIIDRIYFGQPPLKRWESVLTGLKIKHITTHGKAMVMHLEEDLHIYSHNQLYGRWRCCKSNKYPATNRSLRIAIDCQERSALLYSASDIAVLDKEGLKQHPFLSKIGPDVLDESVTSAQIVERLRSKRFCNRQLRSVLLDQSFVAGIGNYLRCETLFYCGLDPRVRSRDLSDDDVEHLAETILDMAWQSYYTEGITNDLEVANRLMEQGAKFGDVRHYVYNRRGKPCYYCDTTIRKTQGSGQAIHYCPVCQSADL